MNEKHSPRFRFAGAGILLIALALLLPAVREGDPGLYLLLFAVTGGSILCLILLPRLFSLDRMIFTLCFYLCLIPVVTCAQTDTGDALSRALLCAAGIAALLAGSTLVRVASASLLTGAAASFLGLLLLSVRLTGAALSFSLTEAGIFLLLTGGAALLAAKGGAAALIPGLAGVLLLFLQGLPVEALMLGLVSFILLWAGGSLLCWVIPVLAAVSFLPGLRLWSLPTAGSPLSLLVSSGLWGNPLNALRSADWPSPSVLFPLSSCFGLLFAGLSVLLFLPFFLRGLFVASVSRSRFHACLAMGCTVFLACRTFAALLAAFGVLPLPLTEIPLWSSSLPDLCSELFAAGLLCGISGRNEADLAEDAHLAMLAK